MKKMTNVLAAKKLKLLEVRASDIDRPYIVNLKTVCIKYPMLYLTEPQRVRVVDLEKKYWKAR